MSVDIKTPEEIEKMRVACRFAASVLDFIAPHVQAGVTTNELDRLCHAYIVERGAYPAPLHYKGFPKSICTSVNEVSCHGVPGDRVLVDGDIINIDVATIVDGWFGDTSEMFTVGRISANALELIDATRIFSISSGVLMSTDMARVVGPRAWSARAEPVKQVVRAARGGALANRA